MDIAEFIAEKLRKTKKAAVDDPTGFAKGVGMGALRGMLSSPGDLIDMLRKTTPVGIAQSAMGGAEPGLGDKTREGLDAVGLKGDGSEAQFIGEMLAPSPPVGKIKNRMDAILVDPKRAIKAGMLNPQQLIDAIKMFRGGRKNPEILSQTGVHVSNPRVFRDDPVAQALIETPGASVGPKAGLMDQATIAQRLKSGDIKGFDDLFKLYPELTQTLLKKTDDPTSGVLGSYDKGRGELMLNYGHKSTHDPTGIFGHEIGHGIQDLDKVPGGGNPDWVASRVQRIAPVAQHRSDVLTSALLARQLADRSGASARARKGPLGLTDVENAWKSDRAATKGAYPLTDEVAITAASREADDIERTLMRVNRLNAKVPPNAFTGYENLHGEAMSRIIEKLLGKSVAEARKIGDLHTLDSAGAKLDDLFDLDEFTVRALKGVGAYKPFR
jgi:hypothetical protein